MIQVNDTSNCDVLNRRICCWRIWKDEKDKSSQMGRSMLPKRECVTRRRMLHPHEDRHNIHQATHKV